MTVAPAYDDAAEAAGVRTVATVRVEVGRLPRADGDVMRPCTPAAASWLMTAAPMSTDGVPHVVQAYAAGATAATSSRIEAGTS